MEPYRVALIQQQTRVIVEPKQRNRIVDENLDRIFELLDWTALRLGDVKLAVFSEYGIIGQYRPRETRAEARKIIDRLVREGSLVKPG